MKIGRVFVKRNSQTPDDPLAFFGAPDLFTPKDFDEIHISCVFTWDRHRVYDQLKELWMFYTKNLKIGGPGFDDPGGEFTPGLYLRKGITITSRGCIFKCPWCTVRYREGYIRELKTIHPGNEVQDNNLLACSKNHVQKVFQMLRTQKSVRFPGGLDARLIKDWHIDELRSLRIKELWFAADTPGNIVFIKQLAPKLVPYFKRNQLRCYVLIGYEGDTINEADERCQIIYDLGFLPFSQRYRTTSYTFKDSFLFKDRLWNLLNRKWSRPAAMKASQGYHKQGGQDANLL